ncbi:RNA polymerase sigma factor [Novipirellula sp. SH528]|uniref:RNA polymerase sigma factor n=1 Tax=Novipirellula sp. SH528 TaxID=3454466 RepID=UPI003FA017B7
MAKSLNPETDLTTDELIAAVLDGRTEAFAAIVDRYQHSVLRIVNAMLYDRSSTEDLVQQVFINAYRSLDRFEAGREFGSWIRVIARNVVREELRRSIRYGTHLNAYAEQLTRRWIDDEIADEAERELDSSLAECLKKLADRSAKIVNLRYYENWSCDRIAEEMKMTSGAVRNVLCRARIQLHDCIAGETT